MLKRLILVIAIITLLPINGQTDDIKKISNTLDLQDCITMALENHPSLRVASSSVAAAQAGLDQSKAAYLPQASWTTSFTHGDPAPGANYDKLSTGVNVSQLITDFGRTSGQVAIGRLNTAAAQDDLRQARVDIVYAVKEAFWGLSKAAQNQTAYKAEVARLEQHRSQAQTYYTVGTKPKIEVTKAEVELNQARLNLLKAGGALRLARVKLNNAMGLPEAKAYEITTDAALPASQPELSASVEQAYARRADLSALNAKLKAAERQIAVKQSDYYPSLKAGAGYDWSGKDYPLDREWTAGVNLDFPLFKASTKAAVNQARAEAAGIKAQIELMRQNVRLEVESAVINLNESREQVSLAELSLKQARENRELAQGRYASGVGSAVEVTDALTSEIDAQTALNSARYDYRLAQASLDKATGVAQ